MNVRKVAETDRTITIGWDLPAGQIGYVPTIDGSDKLADGRRHVGYPSVATQVRIGKPAGETNPASKHVYGVRILGIEDEGVYDPTPPPGPDPMFGTALPGRLARSAGSVLEADTWAKIESLWRTAPAGSTIRSTQPITISGTKYLDRIATAAGPLTLTGAPLLGGQIYLAGAYAHVDLERGDCYDGWKVIGSHMEIRGIVRDAQNQGILAPVPDSVDVQAWGVKFRRNGLTGSAAPNQRHASYWAECDLFVCGNGDFDANQAFCVQIGPNAKNGFVVNNRMRGGVARAGVVVWTEGANRNHVICGNIIEFSPVFDGEKQPGLFAYAGTPSLYFFDNIEWKCGPRYIEEGVVDHCVVGDPAELAKAFIGAERFKYVPPFDRNGVARVTADAGDLAISG